MKSVRSRPKQPASALKPGTIEHAKERSRQEKAELDEFEERVQARFPKEGQKVKRHAPSNIPFFSLISLLGATIVIFGGALFLAPSVILLVRLAGPASARTGGISSLHFVLMAACGALWTLAGTAVRQRQWLRTTLATAGGVVLAIVVIFV